MSIRRCWNVFDVATGVDSGIVTMCNPLRILGNSLFGGKLKRMFVHDLSAALREGALRVSTGLVLAGTRQMRDLAGSTGVAFRNLILDAGGQVTFTGSGNHHHRPGCGRRHGRRTHHGTR